MLANRVYSLVQFSLKNSLMTCMKLSLSYLIGHMIPAKATRNTIVAYSVYVVCYRRDMLFHQSHHCLHGVMYSCTGMLLVMLQDLT